MITYQLEITTQCTLPVSGPAKPIDPEKIPWWRRKAYQDVLAASRQNPGTVHVAYRLSAGDRMQIVRTVLGSGGSHASGAYDGLRTALEDLIGRITRAGKDPRDFGVTVIVEAELLPLQISGRWVPREPALRVKLAEVKGLLAQFQAWQVTRDDLPQLH